MIRIVESSYVASAESPGSLPDATIPEVAFAGRSNVGKSSLMNRIMDRKNLVRVSSTPGCTRMINFFRIRLSTGPEYLFVDLPGYGYARTSKKQKKQWGPLMEGYLSQRETLGLVVLLVDLRRGIEEEEKELADFLSHYGKKLVVVATKTDRAKSSKKFSMLSSIRKHVTGSKVIGFSARTGEGTVELLREIQSSC